MKNPSPLVNALIAKSILETILVGVIVVVVYMNAFPPTFKGWGEAVPETKTIAGWAVDASQPWQRVEVHLYVDGKLVATQIAHHARPDVSAAGWAKDEWHGYNFVVNHLPVGSHEARVYALHQSRNGARYSLQMLGDPIRFEVNDNGNWK